MIREICHCPRPRQSCAHGRPSSLNFLPQLNHKVEATQESLVRCPRRACFDCKGPLAPVFTCGIIAGMLVVQYVVRDEASYTANILVNEYVDKAA
ncbi:hypothetical protein O181_004470 [Austropuccinia psidii MF-1]|uniref:Uncharacterized protein n=1 Tax=Austropuccinia psidii MF-1 TaxID=1389203 RepID=A0A9Q3GEW2_9BASI|nr:hypothetical protein [Austropuccinia psidii MF-1]